MIEIDKEYTMISVNSRNLYKAIIEELKSRLRIHNNNFVAIENQYNFENNVIVKDLDDNIYKKNYNKKIKEPLLVDHIIRYDNEVKKMDKQIKVMGETNENFDLGLAEIKKQGEKIDKIMEHTDNTTQHLNILQQFYGVMKNKTLFKRLKLLFIVFLLFIADILALCIKFR